MAVLTLKNIRIWKTLRDTINAALVKVPGSASFTAAAEATNAIAVTIQLKDVNGTNLAAKTACKVWLSDTAAAAPSGTAPNGSTSFTTGTTLKEVTTKVLWDVVTDSAGRLVLNITDSGAPTFYVNVACGAVIASSSAVTFAA